MLRRLSRSFLLSAACFGASAAFAQNDLEDVIVETYYISNADDATDVIGGTLVEGSRVHRIYLDLCSDCTLRAIYGDTAHPLSITSTAPFFNNLDRGRMFGHEINSGALDENTVAVDSWLSLGAASTQKRGIPKEVDTDGSIVGGANNDGGSAEIAGGLLANNAAEAGFALTERDGLISLNGDDALPPGFVVTGTSLDSAFNDSTLTGTFVTEDLRVGCISPGTHGGDEQNRILIAQLTTNGELAFALNIEVERADGTLQRYVSSGTASEGTTVSGLLVYPPECGCTDPNYLEYDPNAGCDDGSCQTEIVFGCLDPLACNYDPAANFNVPQLCCYGPDSCNGLDPQLICEGVGIDEHAALAELTVYPNPAADALYLRTPAAMPGRMTAEVLDAMGRVIVGSDRVVCEDEGLARIDVSALPAGAYLLRVRNGDAAVTRVFLHR